MTETPTLLPVEQVDRNHLKGYWIAKGMRHDVADRVNASRPDSDEFLQFIASIRLDAERATIERLAASGGEDSRINSAAIQAIEQVCSEEGASVTMTGSNPDFNGMPNEAVTVCCGASNWEDITFRGDTVAECLAAAVEFMATGKCPACKEVALNEYRTEKGTCGWCGHDIKIGAATGFVVAPQPPAAEVVEEVAGEACDRARQTFMSDDCSEDCSPEYIFEAGWDAAVAALAQQPSKPASADVAVEEKT